MPRSRQGHPHSVLNPSRLSHRHELCTDLVIPRWRWEGLLGTWTPCPRRPGEGPGQWRGTGSWGCCMASGTWRHTGSSPRNPEVWEVRPEPLRCRWRQMCVGTRDKARCAPEWGLPLEEPRPPHPPPVPVSPGAAGSSASLHEAARDRAEGHSGFGVTCCPGSQSPGRGGGGKSQLPLSWEPEK